jgi:hypothetical protein
MTRSELLRRILERARADARVVGVADYGSGAEGRVDAWSDLDLVIFVREAQQAEFAAGWRDWVAGLGELLLVYGGGGHPRLVVDAEPLPVRADLGFFAEGRIQELPTWATVPVSAEAMALYDITEGQSLTAAAAQLVGRQRGPTDLRAEFAHVSGDLWYYLLRVAGLMRRGELLAARTEYHWFVLDSLAALMRLEAGDLGRWRLTLAVNGVGQVAAPAALARLEACVPGADRKGFVAAAEHAAVLGMALCTAIAQRQGWDWPQAMGAKMADIWRELET